MARDVRMVPVAFPMVAGHTVVADILRDAPRLAAEAATEAVAEAVAAGPPAAAVGADSSIDRRGIHFTFTTP